MNWQIWFTVSKCSIISDMAFIITYSVLLDILAPVYNDILRAREAAMQSFRGDVFVLQLDFHRSSGDLFGLIQKQRQQSKEDSRLAQKIAQDVHEILDVLLRDKNRPRRPAPVFPDRTKEKLPALNSSRMRYLARDMDRYGIALVKEDVGHASLKGKGVDEGSEGYVDFDLPVSVVMSSAGVGSDDGSDEA